MGVLLTKNGNFNKSKIFAVNEGTKAMYGVLKLNRIHSLSINCQLDLQCIWQNGKTHIIIWLWNMGTWEHRNNWKGSNKIL